MNKRFSKTFVMCVAMLSMSFYLGATAFASEDGLFGSSTVIESDDFVAGTVLYDKLSVAIESKYDTTIQSEYCMTNTVVASGMTYASGAISDVSDEEVPAAPVAEETTEQLTDFANIGIAVTSSSINVRQQADANSDIVGKLFDGAFVTITETGDWCKVVSGDVAGYVKSELLAIGTEAESVYDKYIDVYATVTTKLLNVRSEQNMDSETIAQIKNGEKYSVVEKGEEWVKISVNGKNGYVASEYIDIEIEYEEAISINDEEALIKAEAKLNALNAVTETVSTITYGSVTTLNEADFRLFVCLIYAESGGEPYEGKLGVANVILNRLHSSRFPDTMEGVVYQKGQFGPVKDGALNRQLALWDSGGYTKASYLEAIQAANDALNGKNNIGTRLFFNGYKVEVNKGHTDPLKIGNHLFWQEM